VLEKATINGQEVYEINTILTGDFPSHTLSSEVLKTFDPFSPIKKAVIILTSEHLPDSENQFQLQSTLSQPSIELSVISDGPSIIESPESEKVLVFRADKNLNDHIKQIESALKDKFGDSYMLSIVTETPADAFGGSQRQLLQAEVDTPKLSTKPRSSDFPVLFIIIASFVVLMIFGLVFISYELAYMGPGDNIAYKLGAAASKKNQ